MDTISQSISVRMFYKHNITGFFKKLSKVLTARLTSACNVLISLSISKKTSIAQCFPKLSLTIEQLKIIKKTLFIISVP